MRWWASRMQSLSVGRLTREACRLCGDWWSVLAPPRRVPWLLSSINLRPPPTSYHTRTVSYHSRTTPLLALVYHLHLLFLILGHTYQPRRASALRWQTGPGTCGLGDWGPARKHTPTALQTHTAACFLASEAMSLRLPVVTALPFRGTRSSRQHHLCA